MNDTESTPGPEPEPEPAAPADPAPGAAPSPTPPPVTDSGIGWGPQQQPDSPDGKHVAFGPVVESQSPAPASTPRESAPESGAVDDDPPESPDGIDSTPEASPQPEPESLIADAPTAAAAPSPIPPTETSLPESAPPGPVPPASPVPSESGSAAPPPPDPVPPAPPTPAPPDAGPAVPPVPSDIVSPAPPAPVPSDVASAAPVPPGDQPSAGASPPSGGQPPTAGNGRRRRILIISAVGIAVLLGAGAVLAIILVNAGATTQVPSATAGPQTSETPAATTPTRTEVAVPASTAWTGTGIDCTPGLVIDVVATGSVSPGEGITNDPNGAISEFLDSNVVPDVQHAALVGRVGGGDPFFVGGERTVICPDAAGELEFGINDEGLGNNAGSFDAVVTTRPDVDPASLASTSVEVSGAIAWTPSGITCVTGDLYRASAIGVVTFEGATDEQDAGPDGVQAAADGKIQRGNVLTTASHRGLIARVGEGAPFAAGSSVSITCPADGTLEFGPNDAGVGDNLGAFTVTLTRALPVLP